MADNVNFQMNWSDEATSCKNCRMFQEKDGKSACVPPDKSFEQALEAFGECPVNGHCNYFAAK